MGVKDVLKKVAGKVAKKAKKVVNKAVVPNLVQAKKILKSDALKNNIKSADSILKGKNAELTLYKQDFINFANKNKEKGNALDAINKIGKLLAESLLTTTTTNKLNDFKDVYYSSKEYLEKFRDSLFAKISVTKDASMSVGNYTLDQFVDVSKFDFDKFSRDCIKGPSYLKAIDKKRKNFVKTLKSYVNNIGKNIEVIKKILSKDGPLQIGIQETVNAMEAQDIVDFGKGVLDKNYGDVGFQLDQIVSDVEARRKKCLDAVVALSVGALVAVAVSAPAGPFAMLFVGASVGVKLAPFLILLSIMSIINDSKFQTKAFIKKYKGDCNKIKKACAQVFKSMRNIRSCVLEASLGGISEAEMAGFTIDQATIDDFKTNFTKIWSKYSESENRKYGYFENQGKYARMISEIDADLRRTNDVMGDLKTLSQDTAYQNLEKKVKKSIQEVFTPSKKSLVAGKDTELGSNMKVVMDTIVSGRYNVGGIISEFEKKIESLNQEAERIKLEMEEEQQAVSGTGRKKDKTSSMGLFKDGFAKTLAAVTCEV